MSTTRLSVLPYPHSHSPSQLVGDIYGVDGCAQLGLPPTMTAANFGKLTTLTDEEERPAAADLARSLLVMVAQSSCVLVKECAKVSGCGWHVVLVRT